MFVLRYDLTIQQIERPNTRHAHVKIEGKLQEYHIKAMKYTRFNVQNMYLNRSYIRILLDIQLIQLYAKHKP